MFVWSSQHRLWVGVMPWCTFDINFILTQMSECDLVMHDDIYEACYAAQMTWNGSLLVFAAMRHSS